MAAFSFISKAFIKFECFIFKNLFKKFLVSMGGI